MAGPPRPTQRNPAAQPRPDGRTRPGGRHLPGGHVEGFADTHAAHYRAVYADVIAGRVSQDPIYATFADGHEAMLVGDAIANSPRSGSWVKVDRSTARAAAPEGPSPAPSAQGWA